MAKKPSNSKKMRIKLGGFKELVDNLNDFEKEVEKELGKLVLLGANEVEKRIEAAAPRKEGRILATVRIRTGEKGKKVFANVIVGSLRGEENDRDSGNYVTFYEYGSSRQIPRPFIRPAMKRSARFVRKVFTEGIKEIIAKKRV